MSVPELRKAIVRQCDILQAILAFNYQLGEDERRFLTTVRQNVSTAYAKELRDFRDTLRQNIASAAKTFKLKDKPGEFADWFKQNSRSALGTLQIPKWFIDSEIFGNFGGDPSAWQKFPHHAHIAVDFEGSFRPGYPEYYLPEAVLYEDMCGSFNLAFESQRDPAQTPIAKFETKKHYLFLRTAILSAFYFVEAYLNGLAFNYWWDNKANLSIDDSDVLTEWNSIKGGVQWRNFRTKALQYPRVVLGGKHPPLTETNSASLRILLTEGKEVRDAIVHQSPRLEGGEVSTKTKWLVQLRLNDAARIVDAAVGFVLQLNPLLGKYTIKLDWIYSRGANGLFPKESFD